VRAALALLLLVLVAGCSGGNSRNDFVNDALEICRTSNERVQALGTPESFTDTQLYARQSKDAVGDEINGLRELTPPAELEEAFAQYLATLEQRRRQLELLAEAADKNNMASIQGVGTELGVLTAKARTQARRAAIAACEPG
jgi:hypothetical protein